MQDDAELLRRYAEENSEAAFAEIVARHIDLVYSAALRQVGGDAHRAQDVAQLVFATLARKAAALGAHPVLAGWLYNTTQHIAQRTMRAEYRRRTREAEALRMNAIEGDGGGETQWERIRPVLDDAMRELGEREREAVVLRFFARRPFAEIGRVLGLSEDAARMRVERALDKLHGLLTQRGISSTASALAATLANQAVASAPAGLAVTITAGALSEAVSAGAGSLAAMMGLMSGTKITVVLAVAAATTVGWTIFQMADARASSSELSALRGEQADLAARLAERGTSTAAAEAARTERETALAEVKAAAARTRAAPPAVTRDNAAAPAQRLQDLLAKDPEVVKLRSDIARAGFRGRAAPFLRSIGFSEEQIAQAVELYVELTSQRDGQRPPGEVAPPPDEYLEQFRARFGDTAANKYALFQETLRAGSVLNDLSGKLAYAGTPLAASQAEQLAAIINAATSRRTGELSRTKVIDWERVFSQAAPHLSPEQMRGLRAEAAFERNQRMLAAADREALLK